MNLKAIGNTRLSELIKPKYSGEPVKSHVIENVQEPQPDFDQMQKNILGELKELSDNSKKSKEA